jgi:hypothetical protein
MPTPRIQPVFSTLTKSLCSSPVYHVTKDGWKKVSGTDVGELHFEYYPKPVGANIIGCASGVAAVL